MEFAEVIARRRMTRNFAADPIDPAVLDAILATALRAPSAGFTQGVDLVVLSEAAVRERFWEHASDAAWRASERASDLTRAPVVVVPVADPGAYVERYGEADKAASMLAGREASQWPVPYWLVDTAFVVMHVLLAATDAGLGSLFFQLHADPDVLLGALGVPAGRLPIGALILGTRAGDDPSTSPSRRRRRLPTEVLHRDRW